VSDDHAPRVEAFCSAAFNEAETCPVGPFDFGKSN
jgi:hypothetical protein